MRLLWNCGWRTVTVAEGTAATAAAATAATAAATAAAATAATASVCTLALVCLWRWWVALIGKVSEDDSRVVVLGATRAEFDALALQLLHQRCGAGAQARLMHEHVHVALAGMMMVAQGSHQKAL